MNLVASTLRELAGQPFVLRERGSTTRRAFEAAMEEQGLRVTAVFEIESREGVWKAVEQGLGIGVVADFEFVPHSNLRALEFATARSKRNTASPIIASARIPRSSVRLSIRSAE
jgi:DNA-binding transcriptional LysR family regulator